MMAISIKKFYTTNPKNNSSKKGKSGVSSYKSSTDSKASTNSTSFIGISRSSSSYSECKRFSQQGWGRQVRRSECLQSCQKWPPLHSNRNSVLCQPWSMEGCSLRHKIGHMVFGMRIVLDDNPSASIQSRRYGGAVWGSYGRSIRANRCEVL